MFASDGSATRRLAEFGATLSCGELPEAVVHQVKRVVIDTLGCIVGAHPYEGAALTEHVIFGLGGNPEARAIPAGIRTNAANAAYVNAQLSNLLDMDDGLHFRLHFANTSVAAPLAVAESVASSGQRLIQAVAAAYETSAAGRALLSTRGPALGNMAGRRDPTSARVNGAGFATFGAAAGCGNLVGLAPDTMAHAFGIAGYSAVVPSIQKALLAPLTMSKYAAFGQIAWNSVVAVRLADAGFTGDDTVLDGDAGFWQMTGAAACDESILTGGFGEQWWILDNAFKMIPACGATRYPVHATELLMRRFGVRPDQVERVEVFQAHYRVQTDEQGTARASGSSAPWFITAPRNYLEAQLSTPWAIAMTLLAVPRTQWQAPEALGRQDARDLASRVVIKPDVDAKKVYWGQLSAPGICRLRRFPVTVVVTTRDGRRLEARTETVPGDEFDVEQPRVGRRSLCEVPRVRRDGAPAPAARARPRLAPRARARAGRSNRHRAPLHPARQRGVTQRLVPTAVPMR